MSRSLNLYFGFLFAFLPLCSSGAVEMSIRRAMAPVMAWEEPGQDNFWSLSHSFVTPSVGVQRIFYLPGQQLTSSIILASEHLFPSTLSYLLPGSEPLALQLHFQLLTVLFWMVQPSLPCSKVSPFSFCSSGSHILPARAAT